MPVLFLFGSRYMEDRLWRIVLKNSPVEGAEDR